MVVKKPKRFQPNRHKSQKKFRAKPPRNARKMGYDSDWDKYRWRFLHYNKECYVCGIKATVVDHIISHKGDMELFRNTRNHMPLCKPHHDYITGKYDRLDVPNSEGKMEWIQKQREQSGIDIKIKVLPEYVKQKGRK